MNDNYINANLSLYIYPTWRLGAEQATHGAVRRVHVYNLLSVALATKSDARNVSPRPTPYGRASECVGTRESEFSGLGTLWCNVRLSRTEHLDGRVTVSLYRALEADQDPGDARGRPSIAGGR